MNTFLYNFKHFKIGSSVSGDTIFKIFYFILSNTRGNPCLLSTKILIITGYREYYIPRSFYPCSELFLIIRWISVKNHHK